MKNFTNFDLLINPNLKEVDFSQNSLINQFENTHLNLLY